MKCESCKIESIEIIISVNKGLENGIWDERMMDRGVFYYILKQKM